MKSCLATSIPPIPPGWRPRSMGSGGRAPAKPAFGSLALRVRRCLITKKDGGAAAGVVWRGGYHTKNLSEADHLAARGAGNKPRSAQYRTKFVEKLAKFDATAHPRSHDGQFTARRALSLVARSSRPSSSAGPMPRAARRGRRRRAPSPAAGSSRRAARSAASSSAPSWRASLTPTLARRILSRCRRARWWWR
jgi:hypothetical protein